MKAHLLFEEADLDLGAPSLPLEGDVVRDLDLASVVEAMAGGEPLLEMVARRVLLSSVTDWETIRYRHRVLADCLRQPGVVREMYALAVDAIRREKRIYQPLFAHASGVLRQAIERTALFVEVLRRLRAIAETHQANTSSEGLLNLFEMLKTELTDDYFREVEDHLRRLRLRERVLVSAQLETASRGVGYVLRSPSGVHRSLEERIGIGVRNAYSFEIATRDEAGFRALEELTDRGVDLAANALAQSAEHVHHFFAMPCGELAFYVGCCNLHDKLEELEELGVATCLPDPEPHGRAALAFSELRDVGLALHIGSVVVGNDVKADEASPVMVTGANSGGKSTFLRSLHREGDEGARFLRAERGPEGARQYKLVEGPPLATSYGVDLFERMGG